jgi:predicted nucleic acid-binding protein
MFKRNRISLEEAKKGLLIFSAIPVRYIGPDFVKVLHLSKETNIYAYDACFLDCAIRYKALLLTLDKKLKAAAGNLKLDTWKGPRG